MGKCVHSLFEPCWIVTNHTTNLKLFLKTGLSGKMKRGYKNNPWSGIGFTVAFLPPSAVGKYFFQAPAHRLKNSMFFLSQCHAVHCSITLYATVKRYCGWNNFHFRNTMRFLVRHMFKDLNDSLSSR